MQALQQLWESARFTYQVSNPSSQGISQRGTQFTPSASRLKGSGAEDEAEAESSGDSDDESQQVLPGPSQVVTRRAGLTSALLSSDSRCLQLCMVGTLNQIMRSESYFICTVEILLGLYVLVSNSWSCLHVLDVIGHVLDVQLRRM